MQLSKVVGAILNDLSTAQDLANEYSGQLSYKYKKNQVADKNDNILSNFQLPSPVLREITLDLKFIIKAINPDGLALDFDKTQRNCDEMGRRAALRLLLLGQEISELIKKRRSSSVEKTEESNKNQPNTAEMAKRIITPEFGNNLETKVSQSLFRLCHRAFLLGNDLTESEIKDTIANKLENDLLKHEDIQDLLEVNDFDNQKELALVEETRKLLKEHCLACADHATKEADIQTMIQTVKGSPHTDVIVHPVALQKVSIETIQSLRISAKYDNYRWTISEASQSFHKT